MMGLLKNSMITTFHSNAFNTDFATVFSGANNRGFLKLQADLLLDQ
jgi:hypothetical protein